MREAAEILLADRELLMENCWSLGQLHSQEKIFQEKGIVCVRLLTDEQENIWIWLLVVLGKAHAQLLGVFCGVDLDLIV